MSIPLPKNLAVAALAGTLSASVPVMASAYPIDCAILLCLAGGWPASTECSAARAEFIRRITPWPIEPPLQVWNCPMGVSFESGPVPSVTERLVTIAAANPRARKLEWSASPVAAVETREQADIDISGAAFDFVRSIRVFHIEYRQHDSDKSGCARSDQTRLGSYGVQGDYRWMPSAVAQVPSASGLKVPSDCRTYAYRSVFVDWRDQSGAYGSEEVRY